VSKRNIEIEDLLRFKLVSAPQVSPDSRRVVFVTQVVDSVKNRYFSHLWMAELETGEVRQFTHGLVRDTAPCWSPDGRRIAFVRTQNSVSHIWMITSDDGEPHLLDSLGEGAIGIPQWSPRGDKLVFTFRPTHSDWTQAAFQARAERGLSNPPRVITRYRYKADGLGFLDLRQHIWTCDTKTGQVQQITDGEFDDDYPVWSPDGEWIAFLANRSSVAHSNHRRLSNGNSFAIRVQEKLILVAGWEARRLYRVPDNNRSMGLPQRPSMGHCGESAVRGNSPLLDRRIRSSCRACDKQRHGNERRGSPEPNLV
jgi:dipeptidyl aminopeptidase/acylaminoacyl peptidase